ncbi:hypothetical protein JB92DRAFT_2835403 [Gautieria morchelliformis]|nr:hypothetical protein JB92DRAFT_2835403 [Gautieria morchelliformis]
MAPESGSGGPCVPGTHIRRHTLGRGEKVQWQAPLVREKGAYDTGDDAFSHDPRDPHTAACPVNSGVHDGHVSQALFVRLRVPGYMLSPILAYGATFSCAHPVEQCGDVSVLHKGPGPGASGQEQEEEAQVVRNPTQEPEAERTRSGHVAPCAQFISQAPDESHGRNRRHMLGGRSRASDTQSGQNKGKDNAGAGVEGARGPEEWAQWPEKVARHQAPRPEWYASISKAKNGDTPMKRQEMTQNEAAPVPTLPGSHEKPRVTNAPPLNSRGPRKTAAKGSESAGVAHKTRQAGPAAPWSPGVTAAE